MGMKVVLNYNVLFRRCELFMYSILCFSQMLKVILFSFPQSEPFFVVVVVVEGGIVFSAIYCSILIMLMSFES